MGLGIRGLEGDVRSAARAAIAWVGIFFSKRDLGETTGIARGGEAAWASCSSKRHREARR